MSGGVCPACQVLITEDAAFNFSSPLPCPRCGALLVIDWDYVGFDSVAWWIVGLAPPPAAPYDSEQPGGHPGPTSDTGRAGP